MRMLIFLILVFPLALLSQEPQMSVQSQYDLQKIKQSSRQIIQNNNRYFKEYPLVKINGEIYVSFVGKLQKDISEPLVHEGIIIGKGKGKIRSVRIKLENLNQIPQLHQLEYLELAGKIRQNLERVNFDTRTDSVHRGLNLPQPYTGKNVIIGVNDWGFDYTSPMFYDTLLQNSRILAAWDQWKRSGPKPNDFLYGTEYSTWNELLSAQSDTSNQYSYATHGTHVAGIAGGSGAGIIAKGLAFESEYLFTTILLDEAAAIDSWYWMYEKAKEQNKNLVINMSWGLYNLGTSDGTSLASQLIKELTDLGVLFVSSAGNNGNTSFHFQRQFHNDSIKSLVEFYDYALNDSMWGQSIHGWGEVGKNFEVKVEIHSQAGSFLDETPYFSTTMNNYSDGYLIVTGGDTVWYNISAQESHPQNFKPTIRFRIKNRHPDLRIILSVRAVEGNIHFWNLVELTTDGGNWGLPFKAIGSGYIGGDSQYGIGEPTCADDCITVASHTASYINDHGYILGGSRSNFSSIGPRNDGAMKPDISAPGSNVLSSISSFTDNDYTALETVHFNGRDYDFAKFSGTSMSSPAVAGICALVWEANPYLSPRQVKQIIMETARQDAKTGVLPTEGDVKWGFGKVDAMAAVKTALSFVGIQEVEYNENQWNVFPNPTSSMLSVTGFENIQKAQLFDISGKSIELDSLQKKWNVENLASGVYLFRIVSNYKVYQKKVIIK